MKTVMREGRKSYVFKIEIQGSDSVSSMWVGFSRNKSLIPYDWFSTELHSAQVKTPRIQRVSTRRFRSHKQQDYIPPKARSSWARGTSWPTRLWWALFLVRMSPLVHTIVRDWYFCPNSLKKTHMYLYTHTYTNEDSSLCWSWDRRSL